MQYGLLTVSIVMLNNKKNWDHGSMQLVDNGHVDGLLNNLLSIVSYIFRFDCSYIIFYSVNVFRNYCPKHLLESAVYLHALSRS